MKTRGLLLWAAGAVLCCCASSSAELLGSPVPEIRNNFNRLITANSCPGCNLTGAVLNRLDLSGANLEGADLTGAQLNLSSLAGANLRKAVLRGTGLGGASLAKADLRGADLTGASLGGTDFTGALLDNAAGTPRTANLPDQVGPQRSLPALAEGGAKPLFDPFAVSAPPAGRQQGGVPPNSGATRQIDSIPVIEPEPWPKRESSAGFWDSFNFFLRKPELKTAAPPASKAEAETGQRDGSKSAAGQNGGSSQEQMQRNGRINDVCCLPPPRCQSRLFALAVR